MKGPSSTSSSDGRRLAGKALFLAAPFLLLAACDLALPPDAFTWRVVEAVTARRVRAWPGMFYPHMRLTRPDEIGELAGPTRLAKRRPVRWVTDSRGFRFDEASCPSRRFAAVIVGDSNVWASVLDQDQLIASRLSARLGGCVYGYGTATLDRFLSDPDWARLPPVVIYALAQTKVAAIPPPGEDPPPARRSWAARLPDGALVLLDRVLKVSLLRFCQAELARRVDRAYRGLVLGYRGARLEPLGFARPGVDGRTLFSVMELAAPPPGDAALDQTARRLAAQASRLAARGSRLIFMPVPAKSAVLHELVPLPEPDRTLERLWPRLRRAGVEYMDLWSAFQAAHARGEPLYEPDDNHWSPRGVDLASELLASRLRAARLARRR